MAGNSPSKPFATKNSCHGKKDKAEKREKLGAYILCEPKPTCSSSSSKGCVALGIMGVIMRASIAAMLHTARGIRSVHLYGSVLHSGLFGNRTHTLFEGKYLSRRDTTLGIEYHMDGKHMQLAIDTPKVYIVSRQDLRHFCNSLLQCRQIYVRGHAL